jgi:hypothetical protein
VQTTNQLAFLSACGYTLALVPTSGHIQIERLLKWIGLKTNLFVNGQENDQWRKHNTGL